MNTDHEWLRQKAEQEDGQFVGVGGHILRKIESAEKQVTLAHEALRKVYKIATRAQCEPGPDESAFIDICTVIEETGIVEVIQINSKADLNRAVANALHPEPPASERRAIHESGCWMWAGYFPDWCDLCRDKPRPCFNHYVEPHWQPADFCGDPVASYAVEEKVIALGFYWGMTNNGISATSRNWYARISGPNVFAEDWHEYRLIAMCLAALRAIGVEFELTEGWDAK